MTSFAPIPGLIGGALIGLSAVMLMLGIGRVAGISGIVSNAMVATDATDRPWRLAFILGLPLGAILVTALGLKDWSNVTFATSTMMTAVTAFAACRDCPTAPSSPPRLSWPPLPQPFSSSVTCSRHAMTLIYSLLA